ncbi:helix-turn-helix domain-containing protein [Lacticaseibacillus baoqingensis]|nr:helix-turn-helix domain-containing protein [Lacticaseibacillus baoqingensis]
MQFSVQDKINAILDFKQGLGIVKIMRKYGITGTATVYEWIRRFNEMGIQGLSDQRLCRTNYDYSYKIKVIKWRAKTGASLPVTARHYQISHPALIYQWEQALKAGRLQPSKGRSRGMPDKPDAQRQNKTNKQLQEENDYLRVRIAYLEKLHALAQKKKKFQTKRKPN